MSLVLNWTVLDQAQRLRMRGVLLPCSHMTSWHVTHRDDLPQHIIVIHVSGVTIHLHIQPQMYECGAVVE
jgi:hypothetical protein